MGSAKQQLERCLHAEGNIDFLDYADAEVVQAVADRVETTVNQARNELESEIARRPEQLPTFLRGVVRSILR
ncbi:hypothetical protein [Algiphilus sp.]|uniref:hypothetical protein n=1 Tax=Algiphilus sp. TaxID=1872431 RepID=UPI003B5236E6